MSPPSVTKSSGHLLPERPHSFTGVPVCVDSETADRLEAQQRPFSGPRLPGVQNLRGPRPLSVGRTCDLLLLTSRTQQRGWDVRDHREVVLVLEPATEHRLPAWETLLH